MIRKPCSPLLSSQQRGLIDFERWRLASILYRLLGYDLQHIASSASVCANSQNSEGMTGI